MQCSRSRFFQPLCVAVVAALLSLPTQTARADEGGVSFWVPGLYGSLAAVPQQAPGWSATTIYWHDSVSAAGDVARAREIKSLRENVNTLELTLRERKMIERAKGILMSRRNLPEAEAFRLLQRQSQDRRMPMAKLAESIVQADELLESPHAASESVRRGLGGYSHEE